ncbi:uncharacterized protein LOC123711694 [Pieris brassicae]|uniref:uncharacterized protein LOC123711694 n=1 Tax=Pieris brassicae TaxID=7116 RepID=UPI001E66060B|nr:uncharacterized protein LOC123711694 [Pieris brassicae]XP_045520357.1 uncharacterized protein LOC123711694 [Pieris brassicae]
MATRLHKLLVVSLVLTTTAADFTANCPEECKCVWASGNKQADCSQSNFHDIPKTLSTEIQILDLTGNELYEITRHAFEDVRLINLKKLILKECQLLTIHKNGLSGLAIMIELDMSKNNLKSLHAETFRETTKIRWILLNDNQIEKLEDGLFNNLQFLQKIDLSNNHITQIGMKTFMSVPKLNILRLNSNKLEHLKLDTLSALTLSNLDVHDNPWRCDCYLQPFRNWVISNNFYTSPITCSEPPKVHGKVWKELDSRDFACRPSIVYPSVTTTIQSGDNNITLSCQVNGNPIPEVNWVLNAQIIDGTYRYQGEVKYILTQSNTENSRWLNLTIIDAGSTDNGMYLCVAKNPGGVEERNVTLFVTHTAPGIVPPTGMNSNMLPVLIGVSCAAAILLIILVIICYCCCRRRSSDKKKANNSNGEALIEGSVIPEMEKSLISAVNPVTKPPRRYEVPPSITSGGTEMSELNKTLLDNDSVFAHNDDEKRSLDFDHQRKRSEDALSDYGRTDGRAYPPDLLSFPPRAAQISPAASNASTVPDTSRLQVNPVSPIHSPIYGMTTNQNIFRTLPYSRSQSPFTAPITPPVVTPRQGYVTIPRRPRVPSWSSTASTQILPSAEAQEPLYDNLGLRTTANGSSVLSLNKTGLEPQFSPMRNRPLPATPTSYANAHPVFYAPIEEQEPAPSPVPPPFTPTRNSISSQLSNQLSTPGPQEPSNPRMSWTAKNTSTPQPEPRKLSVDSDTLIRKGKPETGSLRRNPRPDKEETGSPTKEDPRKNESSAPLNQSGTMGRSGKIPPRPPPKPKKKPSPEVNPSEPLFEDEGEDGTEV